VTATINVTRTAQIQHTKADLGLTHTWVGDVIVRLKHVDTGTTVTLIDRMDVPASTFGCSGDNLNIVLDDGGAFLYETKKRRSIHDYQGKQ